MTVPAFDSSPPPRRLQTEPAVSCYMFVRDSAGVWHHEACSLATLRVENDRNQCANLDSDMPGEWCDQCLPDPVDQ